jgi:hypothetical protein
MTPRFYFSLRRYELQILTPRSDVASRKVDYVLDLGTVCQLVHCGYDRRTQGTVLYSYYGGRTYSLHLPRFCASVKWFLIYFHLASTHGSG